MLDALDCPVPSVKTPQRSATTTPLQSLSLMNNAFVQRQAKALAERLSKESADKSSQVQRAFLLAFGRAAQARGTRFGSLAGRATWPRVVLLGLFNTSEFVYVH